MIKRKLQQLYLETIENSGNILLSIINNILDLSKLDSNKLKIEKLRLTNIRV